LAYVIVSFFFKRWSIHRYEESEQSFSIRDSYGSCEITPRGAKVITAKERVFFGSLEKQVTPTDRVVFGTAAIAQPIVREHGGRDAARCIYQWLSPGDRVY